MVEPIDRDPVNREELVLWLDRLHDHVYQLRVDQFIFKNVWRLMEENSELQRRPSHIYGWLHGMHADAMASGIRRLCDEDERAVSLVRFLQFVKRNPAVVSRLEYSKLFPVDTVTHPMLPVEVRAALREHIINSGYDQAVGEATDQPRGKDIKKEIRELKRSAAVVIDYVNKRVAHLDKTPPAQFPTLAEIDSAIELAIAILKKYLLLFKGTSTDFGVYFQYDWLAPLRVPWLESRHVTPSDRSAV